MVAAAMTTRPVGYTITQHWCRKCVPEGVSDGYEPLREGEDHGVPYHCDTCGEPLLPCDHDWDSNWALAYTPPGAPEREIRFCRKSDCGEAEYRARSAAEREFGAPHAE